MACESQAPPQRGGPEPCDAVMEGRRGTGVGLDLIARSTARIRGGRGSGRSPVCPAPVACPGGRPTGNGGATRAFSAHIGSHKRSSFLFFHQICVAD